MVLELDCLAMTALELGDRLPGALLSDLPDLIIVLLTGNGSFLLEALYSIRHQGGTVFLKPLAVICWWLRRSIAGQG